VSGSLSHPKCNIGSLSLHKGKESIAKRIQLRGRNIESTVNRIIGVKSISRASKVAEE